MSRTIEAVRRSGEADGYFKNTAIKVAPVEVSMKTQSEDTYFSIQGDNKFFIADYANDTVPTLTAKLVLKRKDGAVNKVQELATATQTVVKAGETVGVVQLVFDSEDLISLASHIKITCTTPTDLDGCRLVKWGAVSG